MSRKGTINEIIAQFGSRRFGLYRGIIEATNDPLKIGRVQVRIHDLHGDETRTSREVLPWAEVNEMWSGSYDSGSYSPGSMVVGSGVFLEFEKGNTNCPIVMGAYRARPEFAQELRTVSGRRTTDPEEEVDPNATWVPPEKQEETPKDVYFKGDEDPTFDDTIPTKTVIFKSPKGHTILVEDKDGEEFLQIIDRAGQVFEMSCGVASTPGDEEEAIAPNAANIEQRGIRSALRGDQLDPKSMVPGRARIRMIDLANQEITLDAEEGNETIRLQNRNREGSKFQTIEMSINHGEPIIRIEGANGDKIIIDSESPTPIVLLDHSGNALVFDADAKQIREISSGGKTTQMRSKSETLEGDHTRNIGGNEDLNVQGNRLVTVMNDDVQNAMGNLQRSIGGAINTTITGLLVAVPPTPLGYCYDLLMYGPALALPPIGLTDLLNSHRLRINEGDFVRQATKGSWKFRTAEGDFDVETLIGDLLFHTAAGNVSLIEDSGTLKIEVTASGFSKATIEVDASGNIHLKTGTNDVLMDQVASTTTLKAETVVIDSSDINLSAAGQTDFWMAFTQWESIWANWFTTQFLAHVHTSAAPGVPTSPATLGIVPPVWTPAKSTKIKGDPTG